MILQSEGDTQVSLSLDKIKKQLASGSGKNLLQGPLLKRSETVTLLSYSFLYFYF